MIQKRSQIIQNKIRWFWYEPLLSKNDRSILAPPFPPKKLCLIRTYGFRTLFFCFPSIQGHMNRPFFGERRQSANVHLLPSCMGTIVECMSIRLLSICLSICLSIRLLLCFCFRLRSSSVLQLFLTGPLIWSLFSYSYLCFLSTEFLSSVRLFTEFSPINAFEIYDRVSRNQNLQLPVQSELHRWQKN